MLTTPMPTPMPMWLFQLNHLTDDDVERVRSILAYCNSKSPAMDCCIIYPICLPAAAEKAVDLHGSTVTAAAAAVTVLVCLVKALMTMHYAEVHIDCYVLLMLLVAGWFCMTFSHVKSLTAERA